MAQPILIALTAGILFSATMVTQPSTIGMVLAHKNYSLSNRYSVKSVNDIFSDNILLTLAYMSKTVKKGNAISWETVRTEGEYRFILRPGQSFAFHDTVLKEYENKVAFTTNAHFNASEGFKSDGWLVGDGVCHLASFMNAVARDAGLLVKAPVDHSFADIPDVPQQLGVSIYSLPNDTTTSSLQNLYITNNRNKSIVFIFDHKKNSLHIRVEELT
ncbi:hypothetical protein A3A46_00475 [Candidatus Roizmanbacteria bacterium RIFCSPLOWO2_01_FULL_37_13]|uniref:Uncharacterized protein n=1 Tax=Candidatus Roizmanbacteria bacterium RIFCSPHIGHO2_02_FULL_38_11 TaxID=1802039 RepID=A0A1F7GYZ8_9BACT|nr:MAG: hypothetical protein A3C25_00235 [Candidatus Roizmanbacteria bacterium RIFCSPHIGHO2_02_FULL_38_11]OGK34760.1 MAG: hypothetical protein A3F58_04240 [Candidatus Roizmanbacteria bacterium RIFCSPHIGHO2_12_FULL_37_9b]OGK41733.1 MAG: hypothetical protein A3A46_00475 [Candidatus Roizmanbacteria bacterium RIFCSPLOWO2_01_FULL_37_13]